MSLPPCPEATAIPARIKRWPARRTPTIRWPRSSRLPPWPSQPDHSPRSQVQAPHRSILPALAHPDRPAGPDTSPRCKRTPAHWRCPPGTATGARPRATAGPYRTSGPRWPPVRPGLQPYERWASGFASATTPMAAGRRPWRRSSTPGNSLWPASSQSAGRSRRRAASWAAMA